MIVHLYNILKMGHPKSESTFLRSSTLAHYFHCAVQAYLINQGVDSPPNEALIVGKKVHDAITESRQPTKYEKELEDYLKTCMVTQDVGEGSTGIRGAKGVLTRKICVDSKVNFVVTHGIDDFRVRPTLKQAQKFGDYNFKVEDGKDVVLTEYKTTNQRYIDNYKLCTALFQIKIYAWLLEPLLVKRGYRIKKLEVVYLNRLGEVVGQKDVWNLYCLSTNPEVIDVLTQLNHNGLGRFIYNGDIVEADIKNVIREFNKPITELIPPARYKCYCCDAVFKNRCPFKNQQFKE